MTIRRIRIALVATVLGVFLPDAALANIGLPMIVALWPGMGVALLPVIVVEMAVLRRRLGLATRQALKVSALANAVTTVIGVPLTWLLLYGIEYAFTFPPPRTVTTALQRLYVVTLQAPWMANYRDGYRDLMIFAAGAWLLVPCFFMSWWMEYQVSRWMLKDVDRKRLRSACMWANLISYGLLELIPLGYLIRELRKFW